MDSYLITLGTLLLVGIIANAVSQHVTATKHTETLGQIHQLVNSRLTEALDDIAALKKALTEERRRPMKARR